MNSVPAVLTAAIVLLAFAGLFTLAAYLIAPARKLGQILAIGTVLILVIGLSVLVQFHLHELKPSFYDLSFNMHDLDSYNGSIALLDFIVGGWIVTGVIAALERLEQKSSS